MRGLLTGTSLLIAIIPLPALAQATAPASEASPEASELANLQEQIATERRALQDQREALDAQEQRLLLLEEALLDKMRGAGIQAVRPAEATQGVQGARLAQASSAAQPPPAGPTSAAQQADESVSSVGEAPTERPIQEVAVLADQGSVLTRAGRITIEPTFEYARVDRNRFVFRGIEIPQSVLVGVFDINESRQDVLSAAIVGRFGVTSRFEIGAKVPWIYREDASVLIPLVQNPPQSGAGTINTSAKGKGLGDVELMARYQLTNGTGGWPFLTANLSVVAPTGTSPFEVPRNALGNATESATGFGFWSVQPSVTVLTPTDPATLFGVLGWNYNRGKDVNTRISDAQIDHVTPGSGPNATAGIGLALNERTSISFAYAHNWVFSTVSTVRPITVRNGIPTVGDPIETKTRDLQIGRFLFGVSYRLNQHTMINWTVEMGVTDDASDLRTSLRIPFNFN